MCSLCVRRRRTYLHYATLETRGNCAELTFVKTSGTVNRPIPDFSSASPQQSHKSLRQLTRSIFFLVVWEKGEQVEGDSANFTLANVIITTEREPEIESGRTHSVIFNIT